MSLDLRTMSDNDLRRLTRTAQGVELQQIQREIIRRNHKPHQQYVPASVVAKAAAQAVEKKYQKQLAEMAEMVEGLAHALMDIAGAVEESGNPEMLCPACDYQGPTFNGTAEGHDEGCEMVKVLAAAEHICKTVEVREAKQAEERKQASKDYDKATGADNLVGEDPPSQ